MRVKRQPGCDWPYQICPTVPTERLPEGAAFCVPHFMAWSEVMQAFLAAARHPSPRGGSDSAAIPTSPLRAWSANLRMERL